MGARIDEARLAGHKKTLWRRWVAANAAGEVLGLGLGALVAVFVGDRLEGETGALIAVALSALVFGLWEGGVVGLAQHTAMRSALPFVKRLEWVEATVLGAVIAWLAASIPMSTASTGPEPSEAVQLLAAAGIGLAAGPVLGVPQAMVLRPYVAHPWRWVAANGAAWAVGMPLVFVTAGPLASVAAPLVFLLVPTGLLVAGAVVGMIHGWVLVRLVDFDEADPRHAHETLESFSHLELVGADGSDLFGGGSDG